MEIGWNGALGLLVIEVVELEQSQELENVTEANVNELKRIKREFV